MTKFKLGYVVRIGAYYTDSPYNDSVYLTKQSAINSLKEAGFKYSKKCGFYLKEDIQLYAKIDRVPMEGKIEHTPPTGGGSKIVKIKKDL